MPQAFEGLTHIVQFAARERRFRAGEEAAQAGPFLARLVDLQAQVLDLGVRWVILGTVACREPQVVAEACRNFPGRVLVGIDAREGKVAVAGWTETTEMEASTLAGRCAELGVKEIIYTDISRDGTQVGVNLTATAALARTISIPVIASGGVAGLEDIRRLKRVEQEGVKGVIIGRALYTGAIRLKEAIKEAQGVVDNKR